MACIPVGTLFLLFIFNFYIQLYGSDSLFSLIFYHCVIVSVLSVKLPQILCA